MATTQTFLSWLYFFSMKPRLTQAMAKQTQSLELGNASQFWSFWQRIFKLLFSKFPLLTSNSLVSHTTPQPLKQMCFWIWCIPASKWSLDSSLCTPFLYRKLYTPENARIALWDFKFLKLVSRSFLEICSHNNVSAMPHPAWIPAYSFIVWQLPLFSMFSAFFHPFFGLPGTIGSDWRRLSHLWSQLLPLLLPGSLSTLGLSFVAFRLQLRFHLCEGRCLVLVMPCCVLC